MTASQTLISGISAAQEAIAGQQNGKSISLADFNSDELKDYQGALEYVNGTMQLNAEKVREIAKAKADEQVAINNSNKALEQAKYLENAKEIEQLRASLASASDSEKASIQESIVLCLPKIVLLQIHVNNMIYCQHLFRKPLVHIRIGSMLKVVLIMEIWQMML